MQLKYKLIFKILILFYFLFGLFNIVNVGITVDESAHLGAAQSYIYHLGLNPEHPVALKSLLGLFYNLFASGFQSNELDQYSRGYQFLTQSSYSFEQILIIGRTVFLAWNGVFLIFLYLFTFKTKFLNPEFSLLLSILYVFSPSFVSHNFLIAFDVAGATGAFIGVITLVYFYQKFFLLNQQKFITLSISTSLWFAFGLHTKFTNLILFIPLLIVILALGSKTLTSKSIADFRKLLNFGLIFLCINLSYIWILYTNTFSAVKYQGLLGMITPQWLFSPFGWFLHGIKLTLTRKDDKISNFTGTDFDLINYGEFTSRVFWFKENPILIITFVLVVVFLLYILFKNLDSISKINKRSDILIHVKHKIIPILIILSFPITYILLSFNSYLVIGYRHFYSVLIFLYAFLAYILSMFISSNITYFNYKFNFESLKYLRIAICVTYIGFGIIAIPQNLSYTNIFWFEGKWRLASDSTINWGQELPGAYQYLVKNGILKPENKSRIINNTWNTRLIDAELWVQKLSDFQPVNSSDYYLLYTDISKELLSDSEARYLVVDTYYIQLLQSAAYKDPKLQANLDFIQTNMPIYNANNILYIFELKD